MDVLRRRLGFASEAPWILSVVLNDVALISSYKCVRADRQWHRAQLSGGGVTWDGHPLIWSELRELARMYNASGVNRACYGSLRRHSVCHGVCETRQFCGSARELGGPYKKGEREQLAAELAQWCLSNRAP